MPQAGQEWGGSHAGSTAQIAAWERPAISGSDSPAGGLLDEIITVCVDPGAMQTVKPGSKRMKQGLWAKMTNLRLYHTALNSKAGEPLHANDTAQPQC